MDSVMDEFIAAMGDVERAEMLAAMKANDNAKDTNKLAGYRPYTKTKEFHAATADYSEVMLMGGNQIGKTWAGSMDAAIHATGRYPAWWTGHRFKGPIQMICGSVSAELTREGMQRLLMGPPSNIHERGTGSIPKDAIEGVTMKRGVANAIDTVRIKHVSGGTSVLRFFAYEQGSDKLQSVTIDYLWFDEEPPEAVYFEGITRTNVRSGKIVMTFTPLNGKSRIVERFWPEPENEYCFKVQMGVRDAEHYTQAQIDKLMKQYPEHERGPRLYGEPQFGSGMVFSTPPEQFTCEPFDIPKHFAICGGLDFGWDHPQAAVKLAYDRDNDVIYVVACAKHKAFTPLMMAAAVNGWGDMPWFWPHDGYQHDKGSGLPLAEQYRTAGLDMWHENATHAAGGNSVEAGIQLIIDLMQTGRLKIFKTCFDLFAEIRQYHRKDGKIVKEGDDTICAMRYALMMIRYARTPREKKPIWQRQSSKSLPSARKSW